MLAKKNRLTKEKEIQQVFKKGKIHFSPFFNLKILKNDLGNPRFCVVVSNNISKKAVVRNKIKRQIRSIIYKNLANIDKNNDYIVLIKTTAVITTFKKLEEIFIKLIKK